MIHEPAQCAQDLADPPIAITAVLAFVGLLADGLGQEPVLLWHLQRITLCTAILPQRLARLSFTEAQLLPGVLDSLSARSWGHQFLEATSLRIAISKA